MKLYLKNFGDNDNLNIRIVRFIDSKTNVPSLFVKVILVVVLILVVVILFVRVLVGIDVAIVRGIVVCLVVMVSVINSKS